MNRIAPVFLAIGAAALALTTQLAITNGVFAGRVTLTRYLVGYAVSLIPFIIAGWLFYKEEPKKPLIVPLRFGKFDEGVRKINGRWHKADGTPFTIEEVLIGRHVGKFGFFFKNDGEPAYDVSASEPHIGTSILKFETDKPRLSKEDGEEFLPAWIQKSAGTTNGGSGLFDEMRTNDVADIEVKLTYKDAHNRWYETICKIERDVLAPGGLTVRYVRQSRASGRKQ